MKILKKGNSNWNKNPVFFECMRCGCQFEAESGEYAVETNYYGEKYAKLRCPHCLKSISKEIP